MEQHFDQFHEEQCEIIDELNQTGINKEIAYEELSGDEAMEQSFSVNSQYMSHNRKAKTNLFMTSMIVTKSILGVGILGLPYVTYNFGLLFTIILIIAFYWQTQYCTNMFLQCKNLSRRSNISTIGFSAFKSKGIIVFINLIIIINNFGLCFAEMIIQGTAIQNVVKSLFDAYDGEWYTQRVFLSSISALIMIPMMIIKKIEKLKFAGVTAICAMSLFCITLITSFISTMKNDGLAVGFNILPYDFTFIKAFGAFPTLLLAYNWEFNLFPVAKGMDKPNDKKVMKACSFGMIIATFFYLMVGIMGCAIYGKDSQTNFLASVTKEKMGDIQFYLLNGSFYISTVLTTPLVFFGARNNFLQLIKGEKKNKVKGVNFDSLDEKEVALLKKQKKKRQQSTKYMYYIWSIGLFVIITIGSIYIHSLEIAFNFVGSVSSNSIGCVLPSLFLFMLMKEYYKNKQMTKMESLQENLAKIFFVYSIIMSFVCLTSEILTTIYE
ncbi:unnamed protein product [Paramecium pentaurelia]|uniref:Amino acid transporter transmembrane domain-containing protein n=1 Tax=Paramecium pentaurelia TaxID=43138 RepID=A0A8S1SKN7_9CILI|nr:unnamed protein product [Paramecium pentaurelia]